MLSLNESLQELQKLLSNSRVAVSELRLAAAGDYAAEEVLSNSATEADALTFAFNVGSSGVIEKAMALCSTTALTPRLTLFLFSEKPTCILADNAANTAVVVNNRATCIGWIDFLAMEDLGTGMSGTLATPGTPSNLPLPFICGSTNTLFGVLVTRDAITGEAVGMSMTIILQIR